jgi:hypothetical protein
MLSFMAELTTIDESVGKFVPGYEASQWYESVVRHCRAQEHIIERLNREINGTFADPKIKARLADLGSTVLAGSPEKSGKLIAEDSRDGV